jgi:uncharacterized membrane protein YuzA (DUF378 family)
MKASRQNTTDLLVYSLLPAGSLSWGLLGFNPIDLTYAPFGSIMVYSRAVCLLAAMAVLYGLTLRQIAPRLAPVGVRRRAGYT